MALDSNAIWNALEERLNVMAFGFTRISRRRRDWGIEEHPVLMILDDSGDEILISGRDDPAPTWRLTGELVILLRNNEAESTSSVAASDANELKRAVMVALERVDTDPIGNGMSHYTDLGGLVSALYVTKVSKGAGEKTGQAVVKISLEMETNPP